MKIIEIPPGEPWKKAFNGGMSPDDLQHPVFSFPVYGLSLLESGRGDQPLQPSLLGWQFLTTDRTGAAFTGEVPIEPDVPGGVLETSVMRGIASDETWKAYTTIKAATDHPNDSFELRRLRISSLRIEAFWLEALPADNALAKNDRVYPYIAFQKQLKPGFMSAHRFLAVVRKLAAKPVIDIEPIKRV